MADEADGSALRVGPYIPDVPETEPNAIVQPTRTVDTPAAGETPVRVRAVARRKAAALPALGGTDGPREVPPSMRAKVDRRKRAAAETAGATAPPEPESASRIPDAAMAEPAHEAEPTGDSLPFSSDEAHGSWPLPHDPLRSSADEAHGSRPLPPDTDAWEIPAAVDSPPASRSETALVEGDEEGDEGSMDEDEGVPLGMAETAPTHRSGPVRPGPPLIDSDTWDEALAGDDDEGETYHGRRRAHRPTRLWVVVTLVLVCLGAAVSLPLLLRSSATPQGTRAGAGDTEAREAVPTAELISAAGSPGTSESASAQPDASGSPTTTPTTAAAGGSAAQSRVVLTYEAESDPSIRRHVVTSQVAGASGGYVVDRIGNWGARNGSVDFTVTVPSAGAYTVTFYYMFLESSDDTSRKAQVSLNGQAPLVMTFSRVTSCCTGQSITLTLKDGANTIRFTHPQERSPAIDKLVITRA
jgi:hypothetical protein